jgi:quercetin dioxygenase-like cupin family protein
VSLSRPIFAAAGEGAGPAWMSVKADAAATGAALGLAECVIPVGHSPQMHVHSAEDEAFYVLEGAVDFACGDERFRGEAGAFVFLPRGLPHSFLGVSAPTARVLVLLIPGGLEELFLESDPERIYAILRAHGVEIVGPPLT